MCIRLLSSRLLGTLSRVGAAFALGILEALSLPAQTDVSATARADDRFQERVLGTIPETYGEIVPFGLRVLTDGKTFGYLVHKGVNYAVVYNGQEVTELDSDLPRQPHNPGGGILFAGKRNGKCVVVLNNVVREAHCSESIVRLFASQDGEHLAYFSKTSPREQEYLLDVDGKTFGPFDGIGHVVFGNDGNFVVSVRRGRYPKGTEFLITREGTETTYQTISPPAIAPDGKTVVYLASSEPGGKVLLLVGGAVKREYNDVSLARGSNTALSSDGLSIAFVAEKHGAPKQECVMVDDRCGEIFEHILKAPRFLKGTHEVTYEAVSRPGIYTVVGSRKFSGQYPFVSDNGKTVARFRNDDKYETVFSTDGKVQVIVKAHIDVNGVERTVDGVVSGLAVSPDGDSVAYVVDYWAQDSGEQRPHSIGNAVVLGDKIGERFPGVEKDSLRFSPDGKALAYVASLGSQESGKLIVVVNGVKSEPFDQPLTSLLFSPDGSKLAFGALRGRQILWNVLAVPGDTNPHIAPGSPEH